MSTGRTVYGVNTGFGKLAQKRIDPGRLTTLQTNLVLSHAAGTGPLLDDDTVRLAMTLKAASIARGFSGVRWEIVQALIDLLEHGITPCVPAKGSVGASGDLAPLAHISAALMGVGDARVGGRRWSAADALRNAGLTPVSLAPKEGLALLNGTQVSTAIALMGLFLAEDTFAAAVVAGSLSTDAARGSHAPFDPRLQAIRGQPGQIAVAAAYRTLMGRARSGTHTPTATGSRTPTPCACQPQVMGACLGQIQDGARVLEIESNAVTDNPIVFADTGEILSGGNFHAEPVALAADSLALAAAEIGALSERRIAMLTDGQMSGLPPFLAADPGIDSGFMIAHITAAALASENKSLAHPSSVDSLPTSANQEDHVSMATTAARQLVELTGNCADIVGIELLAAAEGIDFLRPLKTSEALEAAMAQIRAVVPVRRGDRFFAPDIAAVKALVASGTLSDLVPLALPSREG